MPVEGIITEIVYAINLYASFKIDFTSSFLLCQRLVTYQTQQNTSSQLSKLLKNASLFLLVGHLLLHVLMASLSGQLPSSLKYLSPVHYLQGLLLLDLWLIHFINVIYAAHLMSVSLFLFLNFLISFKAYGD